MFAVGFGHTFNIFFGATSELIAIPTGVKIFNWMATMWGGKIRFYYLDDVRCLLYRYFRDGRCDWCKLCDLPD